MQSIREPAYAVGVTSNGLVIPIGKHSGIAGSGAQLLFWQKRYNLAPGATLSPFRGHKNRLDIETVLGGFVLANATDFIDDSSLDFASGTGTIRKRCPSAETS
jgi:hypothetical protein